MTLGRLVLAWLPVAVWFVIAGWLGRRLIGRGVTGNGQRATGSGGEAGGGLSIGWAAGEAAVVTLFGSLWFDSLGSGGWWLLFLLVGLLAAFPVRLQGTVAGALPSRPEILLALVDTTRYVGAGAILAWRLR